MSRWFRASLVGALVGLTCFASADAAMADPASPSIDALPTGSVTSVPPAMDAPERIAATETVEGFYVVPPGPEERARYAKLNPSYPLQARVFSRKEDVERWRNPVAPLHGSDVCLTSSTKVWRGYGGPWPLGGNPFLALTRRPPPPPSSSHGGPMLLAKGRSNGGVTAVHAERLVRSQGRASLEMTDVWVDPDTLGVRLITKATLPLALVRRGPFGVEVYAARTSNAVEIIVTPPTAPPGVDASSARLHPPQVVAPSGEIASFDCGHARVTLPFERVGGQMATVRSMALLRPLDSQPLRAANGGEDEPSASDPVSESPRMRPMRTFLSVSRTHADREPVLSITFGWGGKEQRP